MHGCYADRNTSELSLAGAPAWVIVWHTGPLAVLLRTVGMVPLTRAARR